MDRLLTADNVADILQVSARTAYGYMSEMPHIDRPRRVTEGVLKAWITGRTVIPAEKKVGRNRYRLRDAIAEDYRIPKRK